MFVFSVPFPIHSVKTLTTVRSNTIEDRCNQQFLKILIGIDKDIWKRNQDNALNDISQSNALSRLGFALKSFAHSLQILPYFLFRVRVNNTNFCVPLWNWTSVEFPSKIWDPLDGGFQNFGSGGTLKKLLNKDFWKKIFKNFI